MSNAWEFTQVEKPFNDRLPESGRDPVRLFASLVA